jgi:predicted RNA-binding protein associated with RNAse of E/G family
MAKKLLLDVLVKVLGEYVELDSDNLDVAVWSGNISLKDLKVCILH